MQNKEDKIFSQLSIILDQDEYIENNEIGLDKNNGNLTYETGNLLIQLISSVSLDEEIYPILINKIYNLRNKKPRLLLYVSSKYGLLNNFINDCKYSDITENYSKIIDSISLFNNNFNYFITFFNEDQIMNYLDVLKLQSARAQYFNLDRVVSYIGDLKKKIINYRFNDLSKNLTGINIEINKDKEEVKEIINYFGFDNKYDEFLTTLDKHFYSETKDSIEISGLIGTFRQFNNDIIIDIAKKVSSIEGLSDIPVLPNSKSTSKIGIAGDYLTEKFNLSKNEEKFLEYFTKILHEEGGHSFLSSIEYFRLTKNITIEIILLLLYKLKDIEIAYNVKNSK